MTESELKAKMDELGKLMHDWEVAQRELEQSHMNTLTKIAELKDQLKEQFLSMKTSKKSQCLEVRYRNGAVKWKTNWIEGFSSGHPEFGLEKYRSVGEPTVAFVLRDEGWEDDGR